MRIQEIYDQYKIMPQLQLHQLRVAGVASIVSDNFQEEIDKHVIISAALLHDMGNIIKFDLTLFPKNLEPHGLKYWENVKQKFIDKYGEEEHKATYKILREIEVSDKIIQIVKAYGFSKGKQTLNSDDYEIKIPAYSDHRVSAKGVESLENRFQEKMNRSDEKFVKYMKTIIPYWEKIEEQIFDKCNISANEITMKKVEPLTEDLRSYEIL